MPKKIKPKSCKPDIFSMPRNPNTKWKPVSFSLDDAKNMLPAPYWIKIDKEIKLLDKLNYSTEHIPREVLLEELNVDSAVSQKEGMFKIKKGSRDIHNYLSSLKLPHEQFDRAGKVVFSSGFIGDIRKSKNKELYKTLLNNKINELKNKYNQMPSMSEISKYLKLTGLLKAIEYKVEKDNIPEGEKLINLLIRLFEFRISYLLKYLEAAISENEIYQACYFCFEIENSLHALKSLPFNDRVKQTTKRDARTREEALLKKNKRKFTDEEVYEFFKNAKADFLIREQTTHGSSNYAYISTTEEFGIGRTKIKNILNPK